MISKVSKTGKKSHQTFLIIVFNNYITTWHAGYKIQKNTLEEHRKSTDFTDHSANEPVL